MSLSWGDATRTAVSPRESLGAIISRAQPHQQQPVADAGLVARARGLERHEAAVARDDGVRRLPALEVVEVRQPGEVAARAVEAQLPDVDVAEARAVAVRA